MWNTICQLTYTDGAMRRHLGLLALMELQVTLTIMILRNGKDSVIRLHLIEVVIIKGLKGLFIGKFMAYNKSP